MIEHMEKLGIKFNIITKKEAKKFLSENNYYMRLASYRANYPKHNTGNRSGQYVNLEFAYLKELSIIDMHLRYLIVEMCLDIEHYLKVKLLNAIENNPNEDGYDIIRKFVAEDKNAYILKKIKKHSSSEYCKNLIAKYYPDFPAWVFVELITFGDLTYLCEFYHQTYGTKIVNNKFMNIVRDIRNASAHSNCLLNRLFEPLDNGKQIDSKISGFVKKISSINAKTKSKNLNYSIIYNIVTLLYVYDEIVSSNATKRHRYSELKEFINNRVSRNAEYFTSHSKLLGIYSFIQKVVDSLSI